MIINILILIFGFVILIKGADIFVDGASSTAGHLKVPKIIIGLTVVAFGTSVPEFAVSVKSIISGNHDIVLGNVIGSNILNILLILGVASLFKPLVVNSNTVKKELPMMILMMTLFGALISDNIFDSGVNNAFTRSDGWVVLLFFSVFIYYLISSTLKSRNLNNNEKEDIKLSPMNSIVYTFIGIALIILGSNFVVDNASEIAKILGVSEKMIGLTIVALGTSLPELVTSVMASRKGESDLAIGNVVGSNIFNIGMVMGVPVALFGGITKINFNGIDLLLMLISSLLLFWFLVKDRKLSRNEGIMFLIIFLIYYSYVIING